jgi:hypothetical protein
MVLADDANDVTRLTWKSVVDPELMQQAMVKNQRDMLKIVARLQEEKVLEHAGGGHNGKIAKYKFLHLASVSSMGVQNEHPTGKGVESEHPTGDGPDQNEHPSDAEGCSFSTRRVSETNTPTPSSPPTTSPSSSADATSQGPADPTPQEGGGGGAADAEQHRARAAAFVDSLDYCGQPPSRTQKISSPNLPSAPLLRGGPNATSGRNSTSGRTPFAPLLPSTYTDSRLSSFESPPPPLPPRRTAHHRPAVRTATRTDSTTATRFS